MTTTARTILIIEDEPDIARILSDYLTSQRFATATAASGQEGLALLHSLRPDFVILDLTLPDIDGTELCRQLRAESDVPLLILSARSADTDKVLGLGFGADDYMTKPFSLTELLARVQAHFRRYERLAPPPQPSNAEYVELGDLTIDKRAYRVTMAGREVPLSAKEFELLYHLASHRNQVFSKRQLLDAVWGYDAYGDENTVSVYIHRLRDKLERNSSQPAYLHTVWGVGYKLSYV